jgi:hypothetical protein
MLHVAGSQMIAQGTDGLSRGDVTEGVLSGQAMLSFIPLHMSAIERHPPILEWIRDWTEQASLEPLTPAGWFTDGHGYNGGTFDSRGMWIPTDTPSSWILWSPPPVAADIAIDELLVSRHKRHHINHIFIVPRLYTHTWRKKLFKVSDLVFEVPPGARSFWPSFTHEPLVIGLTLCFSSAHPWQLRQSNPILELGWELQSMWKMEEGSERSLLCQLSCLPLTLESL